MTTIPTPIQIITKLLPTLIESAHYAKRVQSNIQPLEEKVGAPNIFAAALSDADLSIQTHVELAMIANFPNIPFYGEEWESSCNTKYLAGRYFVDGEPFLVTLDPIDGTRLYLDRQSDYQIILSVVSRQAFEAVIVLFPCHGDYIYALRNKGAFRANFATALEQAAAWRLAAPPDDIYVSSELNKFIPTLKKQFGSVFSSSDYSKTNPTPYINGMLRNRLAGAITANSQVIDGAALAFVAQEMGYIVQTGANPGIAQPIDHPNLLLPGVTIGKNKEVVERIRASCHRTE